MGLFLLLLHIKSYLIHFTVFQITNIRWEVVIIVLLILSLSFNQAAATENG